MGNHSMNGYQLLHSVSNLSSPYKNHWDTFKILIARPSNYNLQGRHLGS